MKRKKQRLRDRPDHGPGRYALEKKPYRYSRPDLDLVGAPMGDGRAGTARKGTRAAMLKPFTKFR